MQKDGISYSAFKTIKLVNTEPEAIGPTSAWKGCSSPVTHQLGTVLDATSTPFDGIVPMSKESIGKARYRSPYGVCRGGSSPDISCAVDRRSSFHFWGHS